MGWFRRRSIGTEPSEIAVHAGTHHDGGRIAAIVSTIALLFSAYSLWETSLKQAQLTVYVTDTISYTRDPYGSFEVLAVPLTISNSGARDEAVIIMKLDVKNSATGETETFESAYTADAAYFGGSENPSTRTKRPKTPFAPLAIAGRSAWSGTVLFYPQVSRAVARGENLVPAKSKIEVTLRVFTPNDRDWIERVLTDLPAPITLSLDVPDFLPGALYSGEVARVRVIDPAQAAQ